MINQSLRLTPLILANLFYKINISGLENKIGDAGKKTLDASGLLK